MGRIIKANVVEIRPGGVLVKLVFEDRYGFIRWRELSWDRRISVPQPRPKIGSLIEARIIDEPTRSQFLPLSLRQVTNPWERADQKYRVGLALRAEIVNIRENGLFVQVAPGIDALIPPAECPLLEDDRLEKMFVIGDQIQAIITSINSDEERMEMSINRHLAEVSRMSIPQRIAEQRNLFAMAILANDTRYVELSVSAPQESSARKERYHPPLKKLNRILLVDDTEDALFEIWDALEFYFNQIVVDGVTRAKDALDLLHQRKVYDIAIIDYHLGTHKGTEVAEELLAIAPELEIIFISTSPIVTLEPPSIRGRRFLSATKDFDEIIGVIEKVQNGYWESLESPGNTLLSEKGQFIQQLGMSAEITELLPNKIERMLSDIRKQMRTKTALLIELNPQTQAAWINAIYPPLTREDRQKAEDGLYYSPARNVAEDGNEFYRTMKDEEEHRELQYFLPLLAYKSCLGIPLISPHSKTRYALFILDDAVREFSVEELDQLRISAQYLRWTIERVRMVDYMRRYEQRYTLGFLLTSIVHEASNKLEALENNAAVLRLLVEQLTTAESPSNSQLLLHELTDTTADINLVKEELTLLFHSYSRIVTDELVAVNIHAVIEKIHHQFVTTARDAGITIEIFYESEVASAHTIQARLEQILTNIVLNAIQQIERKNRMVMPIVRRQTKLADITNDLVIIQLFFAADAQLPLQIAVFDTGPGIPYDQKEDIFLMDISMREQGHGLGLFISRGLLEAMGGQLRLVDTVRFMGSVFVVALPLVAPQEHRAKSKENQDG